MTSRLGQWLIPIYLGFCLVLGGASAAGLGANVALQLAAVPILIWAALSRDGIALGNPGRQLLAIAGIALLVALVQLVPLPPQIWAAVPGREQVAAGFELLGQPLPWLPLSLSPYATIASVLWLLPAFAVLLALLRRGASPVALACVIIGVMALSVLIGTMQVSGGTDSPWYFYRITNYGVTVGFFANANHMATLLVVSLPFLCACHASTVRKGRGDGQSRGLLLLVLAGAGLLVAIGLLINGSLAGLGLMVPVALASVMLLLRRKTLPRWLLPVLAVITLASVATVLSGRFDNNLIGSTAYTSSESRYTTFKTSLTAAMDYFPFGSGIGTFETVYRSYEVPQDVTNTYMNHAHSDYIELFLETGALGLAVIALFAFWWLRRTVVIWTATEPNHFARAATIASAAILAHSIVDYPLRTVAISAIFAVCCALMAIPDALSRRATSASNMRPARHLTAD